MLHTLELLPDAEQTATQLFPTAEEYEKFRQTFMDEVIPRQEEWLEARRKSEEEARQRLVN